MKNRESPVFALNNFEGPLDFLWHLIQKSEIDISEIQLHQITTQYASFLKDWLSLGVDNGADFVGTTASLLLLKSRSLLPKHEAQNTIENEELDPRFDIIHQLIDYCRFKDAAKLLMEREKKQSAFCLRGDDGFKEFQKPLGIDHISLQDLAALFQQVAAKAESQKGFIQEELWKVSDKMKALRQRVNVDKSIAFLSLFPADSCREELIVIFLAVLELMKLGEIVVSKDRSNNEICITKVK